MARGDEFSLMADEVIRDIQEKKVPFHRAFSWAAHRRHLWHHLERGRYNNWFCIVRERVSRREKVLLKKALQGERRWQHGKIIKSKPSDNPYQETADTAYLDPWDPEPLTLSDYDDNIGYIHRYDFPYLEAAPS